MIKRHKSQQINSIRLVFVCDKLRTYVCKISCCIVSEKLCRLKPIYTDSPKIEFKSLNFGKCLLKFVERLCVWAGGVNTRRYQFMQKSEIVWTDVMSQQLVHAGPSHSNVHITSCCKASHKQVSHDRSRSAEMLQKSCYKCPSPIWSE